MGVPNLPGRRKAMPKPFQRKSITIATGVKREWREVLPHQLLAGDILSGHGVVHPGGKIEHYIERDPYVVHVVVTLMCGDPEQHQVVFRKSVGGQALGRSESRNALEFMDRVLAFTGAS